MHPQSFEALPFKNPDALDSGFWPDSTIESDQSLGEESRIQADSSGRFRILWKNPIAQGTYPFIAESKSSPSYYVGEGAGAPSPSRREAGSSEPTGQSGGTALLALDLGTQSGWALRSGDNAITSGSISFKPGRFEGGGMRFLRFKRWLDEVQSLADGLAAVYFEEVRRHAGVDAAHAYGGFLAHLTAWCEHHGVPYQGVPVGTIKKHATGKGNADKAAMLAAMRARGFAPADDNEADALALLDWVIAAHTTGAAQ
jgi:hypothetical protein